MDAAPAVASPRTLARIGGLLYLLIIIAGLFGEAVARNSVIVPGDAAATAANLRTSELLWRVGIAGNLFHLVCAVVLAVILYVLLRPVGRDLALLAVFFELMSIAVEAVSKLPLVGALFFVRDAAYLVAFTPEQLDALAYLAIRWHGQGFGFTLIFFGGACLVLGYLIFRSGFLPRILGVGMGIAGVAYLVNSFALILSPPLASRLYPAILLLPFVGETALCLWLLIKGVDVERWWARASRAPGAALA